jgi:two-component system chemotaxis response regulator CheY
MKKIVMDVGNCRGDHALLAMMLRSHFDADAVRAADADEAMDALETNSIDLVLVNRVLDDDRSEGIDLVRHLKADPKWARIPVMLISNYPEAQEAAVAAGAAKGFGKDDLESPETVRLLGAFLSRLDGTK